MFSKFLTLVMEHLLNVLFLDYEMWTCFTQAGLVGFLGWLLLFLFILKENVFYLWHFFFTFVRADTTFKVDMKKKCTHIEVSIWPESILIWNNFILVSWLEFNMDENVSTITVCLTCLTVLDHNCPCFLKVFFHRIVLKDIFVIFNFTDCACNAHIFVFICV